MAISTGAAILGGAAVSGLLGASGAKSAGNAQLAASREATEEQRRQYDLSRQDQMPWMTRGNQAGDRLSYLLGLSPTSASTQNALTRDQIRGELLPQFTTQTQGASGWNPQAALLGGDSWSGYEAPAPTSTIDEVGLSAAIQAKLAGQDQQAAAARTTAQNDPNFGSLMRNFGQSDLDNDVVHQAGLQFGLNEGIKGINRTAAASGNSLSGAALKALTRYGNDYGSTKANESYNRSNTNKLNQFNMLSGVAGTGQAATNQVQSAGQNMANNVSNNMIGAGNARGASAIAQGNALTGAIGQGINSWQQNQFMNRLFPGVAQQPGVTDWASQG